jgi:hypothetical protein
LSEPSLKKMADQIKNDPSAWKYLNVVADAEKISMVLEEATRVGLYNAAKRNNKVSIESMMQSREGTVDFGVHGSDPAIRKFSSATAFFNPGVQSFDRFIRAFKDNPGSATFKAFASVTVPSILLYMKNKDDPDYYEIPQWRRDLFWNIKVGDKNSAVQWISIVKPFVLGQVFGSAPERFLEWVHTKDPKAFKGLMGSLIDSALPTQGDPAGAFLPTIFKPWIENVGPGGWSFFKERPIVPEGKQDMLPELQYGKYATETAKAIGLRLGYSPAKIENIIQGYTGGAGALSLKALDLSGEALTGKKAEKRPSEWADYQVISAFVGRPVESDPQSLRDFYDEAKEIESAYKSYMDRMKNNDIPSVKRILKQHPMLMLSPTVNNLKSNISNLDKMIDTIVGSRMSDDKKRKEIKSLEIIRMKIAKVSTRVMEGKTQKDANPDTLPKPATEKGSDSKETP